MLNIILFKFTCMLCPPSLFNGRCGDLFLRASTLGDEVLFIKLVN